MRVAPLSSRCVLLVALAGAGGCSVGRRTTCPRAVEPEAAATRRPPPEVAAEDDAAPTVVEMTRVHLRSLPGVALDVRRLRGRMRRTDPFRPPSLHDPRSFALEVDDAEIGLGVADLGRLMNEHVFGYAGAPLRRVEVTTRGSRLRLRGMLASRIPVPIEMELDVCADGGEVRLVPRSIRVLGLELTGLLRMTRTPLDRFLDLSGARGVRVEGSCIVLDPRGALPPPSIEGRVVDVRVQGDELVLTFGRLGDAGSPKSTPPAAAGDPTRNGVRFRGGTLHFGRLFMVRAELRIVDADPADPFDFDLAGTERQLVAGYSRYGPDGSLLVVVPDLDDAERGGVVAAPEIPGAR